MPFFRALIDVMEFDAAAFNDALINHVEKEMKLAGRKFATAALARIPVRTGFVAGSFGTLQDLVGGTARLNPVIAFVRKQLARAGRILQGNQIKEYYYPPGGGKVEKTPTSGRQFATSKQDIIQHDSRGRFAFTYDVDISYFRLNDAFPGRSPTAPWEAFEAAEAAFVAHMEGAASKLPLFNDYIIKSTREI